MEFVIDQNIISRVAALEPRFGFLPRDTVLWRGTRHVSPHDISMELQEGRFFSPKRDIAEGYLGSEIKNEEVRASIKKNRYLIEAVANKDIPCAFINTSVFNVLNSIWAETDIAYILTPQIFQSAVLPKIFNHLMGTTIRAYCENNEILLCHPAEDADINSIRLYENHSFSVVSYQGSS